jgi:hypothetical protein
MAGSRVVYFRDAKIFPTSAKLRVAFDFHPTSQFRQGQPTGDRNAHIFATRKS